MPFQIIHNDITKMNTDAIVNAANSYLQQGGGVCGAIFQAAGAELVRKECEAIGSCLVGHSVITKGYHLPAKYIIHTVGPIWNGGEQGESKLLAMAYRSSLELAKEYNLSSISIPLISSGIYGYPKDEALPIAISAISEFLLHNDMDVNLVVFDRKAISLSEKLFTEINHYIDTYYEDSAEYETRCIGNRIQKESIQLYDKKQDRSDNRSVKKTKKSLKEVSIEEDKCCFMSESFPRSLDDVMKQIDETKDFLMKAGYTLSNCNRFDVIIRYFIENKKYDIFVINEALFTYEQPLLGA